MNKLLFSGKINVGGLHSFHKLQTALNPWIVTVLDASVSEGEGPGVWLADMGGWGGKARTSGRKPQGPGPWSQGVTHVPEETFSEERDTAC